MTCPACRETMRSGAQCYVCPRCRGEFFRATDAGGIEEAWRQSMTKYYKALRDTKSIDRVEFKYGFLRKMGRAWEDLDASGGLL